MASNNPFSNPAPHGTGSSPQLALDNLIRRELRVSDPTDASQIAEALRTRYQSDPRTQAITQEANGLPFLLSQPMSAPLPVATTSSSQAELLQAVNDVNQDLQELTTNAILKDISPELQGWGVAIRTTMMEGSNAARFSLDPRQRDKTFGLRRTLGDYARMSRLLGAMTPGLNTNYRKLAQSLDEVAAVFLVMMGEALANTSFSGGRFLLQAPFSELQVRRDAAVYALRNLIGSTQQAFAPNEWPRGLDAYRRLFLSLEQQGQSDLRSLLVEHELTRIMDGLVQRANNGSAEGMRALGATAQLDLERFRRLVFLGQGLVNPASPPLTAFLEALQLFADAFETSGGFRLLRIARPPVLFYGLYGLSGTDEADRVLLELVIRRNQLAEKLDCFLQCGCTPLTVTGQVILDKVLYDIDRAIDLYALGVNKFGEPEQRAGSYAYLIKVILDPQQVFPVLVAQTLTNLRLLPGFPVAELGLLQTELLRHSNDPTALGGINLLMQQELSIQKEMEARWENMVKAMAPSCAGIGDVFDTVDTILDGAIAKVGGLSTSLAIILPPHYESSLDTLANDAFSNGGR
ncbi:hypothetical protein [Candidatus Cyanaurora vandensis]|uniref:hypothetical protein n=1 Tax=Candidatus Cyanaurora vandensis TaxID=2714958 RepID=UPI00257A225F|nr:hypothetical protein [Candidatus Cyanaurora vandensis]